MIKRESKKRRLDLNPLAAVVLAMVFATSALAISIPDDTSIGTWDSVNRIYTLTSNVSETIQITQNNLTLDGNGKNVSGSHSGSGVYLYQRTGVTINNLNVQRFSSGIYLWNSSYNTLTGNTVWNNSNGIYIRNSSNNNTLTDNTASNNYNNGIYLFYLCNNNTLTNNTASNNYNNGIYLYMSSDNSLTGNTVNSNNYIGIWLWRSSNNQIYNNNFIGNLMQAHVEDGSGNVFNLPAPDGGNHWSDWTNPDGDNDGFVDSPYVIAAGVQDNLPWVRENGWALTPQEAIEQLIDQVAALNLPKGFVGKLNDAAKVLSDANPNNNSAAGNKLNDFIDQVNNNVDKIIDAGGDPAALIAEAEAIIAMLNST